MNAPSAIEKKPFDGIRSGPLAAALIILAVALVYGRTLETPFVLDDPWAITKNPSTRQVWPLREALSPPHDGSPVDGRPLVNLSFALNRAWSGSAVWSYHLVNIAIHALAGLVLFGLVRRTLSRPVLRERFAASATPVALAAALLWVVHPLQTESVTYVSQRAESLMGLLYLLTLYCFARGAGCHVLRDIPTAPPAAIGWLGASVTACLLGMACKEVMVSAPLLVLLYDRTFVAGSFREAWRTRNKFYAALASTWVLLGYLVLHTGSRAGTAGFDTGVTWEGYALTQFVAICRYLRLAAWPHPLIFDYGTALASPAPRLLPAVALVLALVAGTIIALWRRPVAGFIGAWFFLILAPTSSVVPVATQTMAEHRMYLPLAALLVPVAAWLHLRTGRWTVALLFSLVATAGWTAAKRNEDYRSELALWRDTVEKLPSNPRAQNNLGNALVRTQGPSPEALAHYRTALELKPGDADTHYNLAQSFMLMKRLPEALEEYAAAVRLNPAMAKAHSQWGAALLQLNRPGEAMEHFASALRLEPDFGPAHRYLGVAMLQAGRPGPATGHFRAALRADPDDVEARVSLGLALLQSGDLTGAIAEEQAALRIKPDFADAAFHLGDAFAAANRLPEARRSYEEYLQRRPDDCDAHCNLGIVLARTGQAADAIRHFKEAIRLRPDLAEPHENMGIVLTQIGQLPAAIAEFNEALRLDPQRAVTHYNLGNTLLQIGRVSEATQHFSEAVRLRPDWDAARVILARLQAQQ